MGDYLDKGVTFQSGMQATHTDLNNLVDNAVIKDKAISYHHLRDGSIADSVMGFPILVFADISNQDYFLTWSATHNEFRKVQKEDFVNTITQNGLTINGEKVVDEEGLVLATMSQPSPNQILFNGKEFRIRANEEENDGKLKLIGRLDAPDGVEIYNEWEIVSKYDGNTLSISPDSDNVGGTAEVHINANLKAENFLKADGTPLVISTVPFFSIQGTDIIFGTSNEAYRYDGASNSLYLTSGAAGDATWSQLGGVLDIVPN